MARGFNVKVVGVERVVGKLRKNATMDDVKNVVKSNVSEMTNNAQRLAPVDTGHLKGSTIATIGDLEGSTDVGAHYGGYVNNGTRFMGARPFLTNAFELQAENFRREMEMLVK